VTYWFNPALKQFVRSASDGSSRVLISSCALIQFDVFQRNTVAGTWDQYPVATNNWSEYVKVIRLTWKAARTIPGGPGVSESVQTWNMALAGSEAGVEEGLQQLNNNYANLSSDGWTGNGTTYSISRSFANGDSYTVSIEYSNTTSPTITARAFVNPPAMAQNQ